MKDKFYSYLDSFNKVTIIYPKTIIDNVNDKKFYVLIEDELLELGINRIEDIGKEYKFTCMLQESLALNIEYTIKDELDRRSSLRTGAIVRTDLFEMLYNYSLDDLGVTYSKKASTFKVWSPVAKEIELELISPSGEIKFYDLKGMPRGVWVKEVKGDLDSYKYRYNVRLENSFKPVLDPYAIASNANAEYNYVINKEKLYQFKYPKPEFSGKAVDAIVYELHIRDFSIDSAIENKHAGTYLGMLEEVKTPLGNKTGIEYLKELGVTHVQILPMFDFGGVDEVNKDKSYNWGYNPVQYNVPEGWYSSNPDDPYARLNELKELIDELHHAGIRVIMDVVYNHVYDYKKMPFNNLVPGYYYRYDERGMMTEVSGCKNDVATERRMVSKFIQESCSYWMKEYNIDGFRFDLMGLIDINTMNDVTMLVKSIDPAGLIYGEGWNMPASIPADTRANMSNYDKMPMIGFFNDRFRNIIKGNEWEKKLGFAGGASVNLMDLQYVLTGSAVDDYMFASPNQSVNYVECHDNRTFYDFLGCADRYLTEENKKDYARLALSLVLVSQGMPFIHAGEEFLRSKGGAENSYRAPDSVNKIDWSLADKNRDLIETVKDLIEIRKEYSMFRYDRKSLIKDRVKPSEQYGNLGTIKLKLSGVSDIITLIIKNNYEYEHIDLKEEKTLIFDGKKKVDVKTSSIEVCAPGVYIFRKGSAV